MTPRTIPAPAKKTKTMKKVTPAKAPKKKPDELDLLILNLASIRAEVKDMKIEEANLQKQILDLMEKRGVASRALKDADGHAVKATRVQNHPQPVINEPRLKKRLGVNLWNKVSTRSLDANKLKAYVASGEIKPQIVAECSDERDPSAAFIKVS